MDVRAFLQSISKGTVIKAQLNFFSKFSLKCLMFGCAYLQRHQLEQFISFVYNSHFITFIRKTNIFIAAKCYSNKIAARKKMSQENCILN